MSERTYYIASAETLAVLHPDGKQMTPAGLRVWLGWDAIYAFPQVSREKDDAKHFHNPREIDLEEWDGMPWYYKLKPGSLEITEVVETASRSETKPT